MPDDFDPYWEWLGIAPYYRPPNHYQLLGLPELESDLQAIAQAADARMVEIRKYQMGPRGRFTQKLLNELAAARVCLLNAPSKSAYDTGLLQKRYPTAPSAYPLTGYAPAPPAVAPPRPAAPPVPMAVPMSPQPVAAATAEIDQDPPAEGVRWWLPLGALFLLMIIGTSVGLFILNGRNKPIAKAEPNHEAEEHEADEQPEPASARLSPEDSDPVLHQEGNGDLNFSGAAAELSDGLSLVEQAGPAVVSGWRDETTVARWRFKVVRPAIFQVQITYTVDEVQDAHWQLRLEDDTKARSLQTSPTGEAIVVDEFFWRVPRGGEQTLELTVTGLPSSAKLTLHSLRLIHSSQRQ